MPTPDPPRYRSPGDGPGAATTVRKQRQSPGRYIAAARRLPVAVAGQRALRSRARQHGLCQCRRSPMPACCAQVTRCGVPGRISWLQPGQRYVLVAAAPGTPRTTQSPSGQDSTRSPRGAGGVGSARPGPRRRERRPMPTLCRYRGAMARYEYHCRACGDEFEVTRPMSESSAPASCPCGAPDAHRRYSSPAMTGRATTATAPAPAPAGGGGGGGCCGGGCCGG